MGNIFIPNGSFLKSSGNDNGYVVEAKNVKGLEEFIREIMGQTPPPTTYTITFNVNGGSGSVSPITGTLGQTVTLPSYNGTKSGYNFGGWNTNSSGSGTNYNASASYTISGNATLYAKWTSQVLPDYVEWRGMSLTPSSGIKSGQQVTLNKGTITLHNNDGSTVNVTNNRTNIKFSLLSDRGITIDDAPAVHEMDIDNTSSSTVTFNIPNATSIVHYRIKVNYLDGSLYYGTNNQFLDFSAEPSQLILSSISGSIQRPKGSLSSIAAVGGSDNITVTVGSTANITAPTSLTLTYGANTNKTASTPTATYNGANVTPTWSSDNTSVATVSGTTITAKAAGSAILTASYDNKTATYSLTVTNESTSSSVTSGWTYTSANTSIATISSKTVTGVAQGTTNIKVNYSGKTCDLTGTVTVNDAIPPTTYYWYAGQSNPTNMTTIDPIVNDMTSAGWRLIGTSIPTYSSSNKLYDTVVRQNDNSFIVTGTSLAKQWVALPANSSACVRDGAGNDGTTVNICTQIQNVTLNGVEYKVYEWVGKAKKLGYDIY